MAQDAAQLKLLACLTEKVGLLGAAPPSPLIAGSGVLNGSDWPRTPLIQRSTVVFTAAGTQLVRQSWRRYLVAFSPGNGASYTLDLGPSGGFGGPGIHVSQGEATYFTRKNYGPLACLEWWGYSAGMETMTIIEVLDAG